MKKVKVLYLLRKTVGGMQTHVVDLASRLDRGVFEIKVVAPFSEQLRERLGPLSIILIGLDIENKLKPLKDLKSVLRLKKILKEEKPDIFHIHGNKSSLVGRLAAKLADFEGAVIITVHNFLVYQKSGYLKRTVASWVERWLSKGTDRIITVSEGLKKNLVEIEGISPDKIVTVSNGIDLKKWETSFDLGKFKKELGIKPGGFLVGTAGRFVAWKGHKFLIQAFAGLVKDFPKLKLFIIGDGPLRNELEEERNRLNLEEKVEFLGFVDDIRPYFKLFDIFVLPSIDEPFGIVLLEAMAARCSIVATDAGGVPEIIDEERTGVLVKPADSDALAEGMRRLILDENLRRSMVEKAYKMVQEKFSLDTMVQKTVEVYKEHLSRR